ncbi:MAG: copper-translocating P-type ATPase [Candidatus Nanohaloarchaea archaeon]|nr:copper-translocating P-type ATPase [Candidatus Nanohaloarchaea archaeon]
MAGSDSGGHMQHAGHHKQVFRRKFIISTILSIPVLAYSPTVQSWLGVAAPAFPGSQFATPLLSVVVFVYGGLPFLRMARGELADREPGMMTLISLAITVAFGYSIAGLFVGLGSTFFWELVTLIDVMLLGHWMEMRSIRRASGALDELAELMPDTAERVVDDGTEEVPVAELEEGDVVLVRPGASIPADGVVVEGESAANESMVTGESTPVDKEEGDEVIGGTINAGGGSLRVEVTATGDDTALAGIMRLVEEAQQSKSDTQLLADRAAGWLFYVAVSVALVTTAAWTLATGFDLTVLERAVTVLVIACPHALGLAVPLVVAINTSLAARNGILVRDRIAMETARELDTVMFDKTGTLTEGERGVVDMATDGMEEDEALRLMAAVEQDSEHSIAAAIRRAADDRGLSVPDADGFEAIKGQGVRATVDGEELYVGGPNLAAAKGFAVSDALQEFADSHAADAASVVHLFRGGEAVAGVALADVIREESREAIDALHEHGIDVAMMTGDSEAVARAVADDLGIDTWSAEVLPEEKDAKVQELQQGGKTVAMVGDGVNDAPALARADVGIAIGSGTDVAVESADIVLVENDPRGVVKLVRLSDASYRKMLENLFWATAYNIIALPLAAGVLMPWNISISPAVGALFMSASTVIVAVNAQRLRTLTL